jgi:hypothetical protein
MSEQLISNLNELVQDAFSNYNFSYDAASLVSGYNDKYSYVYSNLLKVKGPDIVKLANLTNPLSFWNREFSYGGFIRSLGVGYSKPVNPPSFDNSASPDQYRIYKPDVYAQYHPLKVRMEHPVTITEIQLKEAFSNPNEIGMFLAGVLQALGNGVNTSMYRISKGMFAKYYNELTAALKTQLTKTLPQLSSTSTKDDCAAWINIVRQAVLDQKYARDQYNAVGFTHSVQPAELVLYVTDKTASIVVDKLQLVNYVGIELIFTDPAAALSNFLGIPIVLVDDFGQVPQGVADSTVIPLYPIYSEDGAVTGTYTATEGSSTEYTGVITWVADPTASFQAILAEKDWMNIFIQNQNILDTVNVRGGGYHNSWHYLEGLLVPNTMSNTIFLA